MTTSPTDSTATDALPTWDVSDLHASFDARSFLDEMELMAADVARLTALFDERGIRALDPRRPDESDAEAGAAAVDAYNATATRIATLMAYVYATVATDTRDERAQALLSEVQVVEARVRPLLARLADWVGALGADDLAGLHPTLAAHAGPLRGGGRPVRRARHRRRLGVGAAARRAHLTADGGGAPSRGHRGAAHHSRAGHGHPP